MSTPTSSVYDSADAGAVAVAAAVPSLPAADVDAAAFRPQGVIIHLTPMASRPRFRVQVRLGNGPDCPIVQPPATLWFGLDGRLQAVATLMTTSEADEKELEQMDDDDNADDDDDKVDSNDEEIDVDGASIGNSSDNNVGQVSSVNIIDGGDVDDDDDDDNEVVFLGEVVRNGRAEV